MIAALEAVCYQTHDLISAMRKDWTGASDTVLRVDGGMVGSDWTMQCLADILDAPVDRPTILETTALGALLNHVTIGADAKTFQPMNCNFGLFPPPDQRLHKNERRASYVSRARADLGTWLGERQAAE